jgi:hypothetical protein
VSALADDGTPPEDAGMPAVGATQRRRRVPAWLPDVALAAVVAWIAAALFLSGHGAAMALSSDNVAPYVLFDDLFHRGLPLAGWVMPEAPFWLPDLPLAWLARVTAGTLPTAVTLFAVLQCLAFLLLVRWLLAAAGAPAIAWLAWLGLWLAWMATGLGDPQGTFTWLQAPVFVPWNHAGSLLGTLAVGALLLRADAPRPTLRLLLALACAAALLVSDRLFALQGILPALCLCAAARVWQGSRWHGRAALALGLLLAAGEALRWLAGSGGLGDGRNARIDAAAALAGMGRDVLVLARHDPAGCALLAAGLVATLWLLLPHAARHAGPAHRAWQWLAGFVLLSALLPLVASILLGRHVAMAAFRYQQSVQLLLLPLGIVVGAALARGVPRLGPPALARLLLLAVAGLGIVGDTSRAALLHHEDGQARCLADAAAREGLHFGAAGFWQSLALSARFPQGPVLLPLSADAAPRTFMMTNLGWLGALAANGAGLPVLGFVDEYGYAAATLDALYGPTDRRISCPRSTYRLYRPAQGALAHLYREAGWLPAELLARLGRVALPAAAWEGDARFRAGDALHASGRLAGGTPVLAGAIDLPPTTRAVDAWIDYALRTDPPAGQAHWEAVALDAGGRPLGRVGRGTLAAQATSVRVDLALSDLPPTATALGLVVAVEGELDLQLRAVGVQRR